ncbi:AbfB domain-containing protein [Peribacillus sp. NPDC060186]
MPKFSLYSNNYPNMYITDVGDGAGIAIIQDDGQRFNGTFEWTGPWQFGATGQLRLSANPVILLRHLPEDNFRILYSYFGPNTNPEAVEKIRADSTFKLVKGLADPNQLSFQSTNYPDRYILHSNNKLYAWPVVQYPDHQFATFRVAAPLYQY